MRRFTLSIIFAALTFATGVGFTLLSYRYMPPAVSLCELARHPEWYDQRLVRVEAVASRVYEGVAIGDVGCQAKEAWAVVIPNESFKSDPVAESFLTGSSPEIRKAEVLVVGRFDQNATTGCFGPRFGIHAASLELKSPFTSEPLPKRGD